MGRLLDLEKAIYISMNLLTLAYLECTTIYNIFYIMLTFLTLNCRENEKSLRCRSENPILAGSVIENVITLQVSCEYNSSENIFQTNPNLDPKFLFKLIQIWITLRVTSTISPNRENCPNLVEMSASRNYL